MNRWPASGWHLPQVLPRFALLTVERGSLEGKMLCTPWQLAQLATVCWPELRSQAVIAVLVGGDARGRHVEACHQLRVGMATRAGDLRNIGQINRRLGISGRQNAVLAVAVRAGGGFQ